MFWFLWSNSRKLAFSKPETNFQEKVDWWNKITKIKLKCHWLKKFLTAFRNFQPFPEPQASNEKIRLKTAKILWKNHLILSCYSFLWWYKLATSTPLNWKCFYVQGLIKGYENYQEMCIELAPGICTFDMLWKV